MAPEDRYGRRHPDLSAAPRHGTRGAIVNATAADVVTFGRMLLAGGRSASGEQLLAPDTVAEMLRPAVRIPRPLTEHHMCLSMVFEQTPVRRR